MPTRRKESSDRILITRRHMREGSRPSQRSNLRKVPHEWVEDNLVPLASVRFWHPWKDFGYVDRRRFRRALRQQLVYTIRSD